MAALHPNTLKRASAIRSPSRLTWMRTTVPSIQRSRFAGPDVIAVERSGSLRVTDSTQHFVRVSHRHVAATLKTVALQSHTGDSCRNRATTSLTFCAA